MVLSRAEEKKRIEIFRTLKKGDLVELSRFALNADFSSSATTGIFLRSSMRGYIPAADFLLTDGQEGYFDYSDVIRVLARAEGR